LFQRLRDLRHHIVILCETHSSNNVETTSLDTRGGRPWLAVGGTCFLAPRLQHF
jgi:hypothetical protein